MREIKVKTSRSKLKNYTYQLTDWMPSVSPSFIEPFIKYGEEDKGVIVHSPKAFAIFTTGELMSFPRQDKFNKFTTDKE